MKRCLYLVSLFGLLLLLNSCFPTDSDELYPRAEPWLCSINADGTGFRKIKKSPFNTPGLVDIYMTKDNRIIFYGKKLWISDTDVINPVQITPYNLTLTHLPSRLSQSPDGSKLFFAADKNIYQLSYPDYQLTQLTNQSTRWLRNPIVSDLGNYITYSSNGFGYPTKETEYLYYMKLSSGDTTMIPTADSVSANGMYIEGIQTLYYERLGQGLWKSHLDGTFQDIVDGNNIGGNPNSLFSFSNDLRFVMRWTTYPVSSIRLFDFVENSAQELPVHKSLNGMPLGKLTHDSNMVFYVPKNSINKLMAYDLDTGENTVVLQSTNDLSISEFINIAPTWDGSKVYFYADIAEK